MVRAAPRRYVATAVLLAVSCGGPRARDAMRPAGPASSLLPESRASPQSVSPSCIPPAPRPLPRVSCPPLRVRGEHGQSWVEGAGFCCHYWEAVEATEGFRAVTRERCERDVVPQLVSVVWGLLVEPPRVHVHSIPGAAFSVALPRTVESFELELCKNRVCSGARLQLPLARAGEGEARLLATLSGDLRAAVLAERGADELKLTVRAPADGWNANLPGDEFALRVSEVATGAPRCEQSWSATDRDRRLFEAELPCRVYSVPSGPRLCPSGTTTAR